MSGDAMVEDVCSAINAQVNTVLHTDSFNGWFEKESCKPGDVVVLNNSFLFREGGIKTTKSRKYLCAGVGSEGLEPCARIGYPGMINSKFKRFVDREGSRVLTEDLASGVVSELDNLGSIVRALVGRIGIDESAEVALEKTKSFRLLRYDPNQMDSVIISDEAISLNKLGDLDTTWSEIVATAGSENLELPEKLAEVFEKKFSELREASCCPVDIEDCSDGAPTILGEVVARVDDQVQAYSRALEQYVSGGSNDEAINEMLRIAYNFADGVNDFMALVVGISDMKPIVFWLTVSDQFDLADKFGRLPFSLVGKSKPSIPKYREVIAGARNRAFHDIFSFDRPFRVPLTGGAFQGPELRLFREFGNRQVPALDFADRKLVELLEGFTRTSQKPVPLGFWEENLEVMEAVGNTARALRSALLLLVR